VLGPGLPVNVTRTTVEATEEPGEPSPAARAFARTGLSVWFEWEATSTGFVTVDTCNSQTNTVVGVYAGAAIGSLTEVAGAFSSLGPDCLSFRGMAVTFRAVSGMTYKVLVEGRPTFPEEPSFGQGPFELHLHAVPVPVNDDFTDATVLKGETLGNGIYAAGASGYSWGASKEAGEPQHAGDPGGASVWYAWTAPSSDVYLLGGGGRFSPLIAIYTGNTVDALMPVGACAGCTMMLLRASAGTTYRIAFDGALDSGSGAAAAGSVWLNISREPLRPSAYPEAPIVKFPPRIRRVTTSIRKRIVRSTQRRATFVFRSNGREMKFRCKLDRNPFTPCRSPRTYRNLAPGRHVFQVFAISAANNADPSPAIAKFTIPRPPRRTGR
jgi:hypothetical protein